MSIEFIGIAATAPHSETEIAADYGTLVRLVREQANPASLVSAR